MSDLSDFKRVVYEPEVAALKRENLELKLAVKLLREEIEQQRGWPVPAEPLEQTPPDAWGEEPRGSA